MEMKKLMRLTVFLLLTVGLCFPIVIFAETITLKSGKTIKAEIIEITEKYITVKMQGKPISYAVPEIKSIDGWICAKEKIKDWLSLKTEPRQIISVPPKKWTQTTDPSNKYPRVYFTGDKPGQIFRVAFREIYVPNQTALQWAQDEAKSIENTRPNKFLEIKKVTSPLPIGLDNFSWVVLEWEALGSNKKLDTQLLKGQQYYAKIDSNSIIEVVVLGPAKLFEMAGNKEIIDYLSNFKLVKSLSTEEVRKLAYQEDMINKNLANFFISSPEYTKQLEYTRQEPPFTITAPKGWYMALKKENVMGVDRVFFCKYNPEKPLLQGASGPFEIPYIKVAFFAEHEGLPTVTWRNSIVSQLRSMDMPILIDEEIKVDSRLGNHVTALFSEENLITDVYIFAIGNLSLSIKAICGSDEFEETKKEIKEAIDSIRFRE